MLAVGEVVSSILSFLHLGSASIGVDARRRYIRYSGVPAEVTVGNRAYSIRDWSQGGISFETAPDASITVGDKVSLVLKFRLMHGTVTIQQPALVVRSAKRGIAAKFSPMSAAVRSQFDRVLDSVYAERFLASQAA
jgi:hypothetical protein